MAPYKALILDEDGSVADGFRYGEQLLPLQVSFAATSEELKEAVVESNPDVLVLHEQPSRDKFYALKILNQVRKLRPSLPALLLCEAASGAWEATLNDTTTEVLPNPASRQEVQYRIAKLLRYAEDEKPAPYKTRVKVRSLPELRNQTTGRLDAKNIAITFGISLADVSRSIGKSLQSIHKTPDAKSLQTSLYTFERIASAISRISNADNALKLWLNSPNEAFPDKLPVDLIVKGKGALLADLLEDVLLGHPD